MACLLSGCRPVEQATPPTSYRWREICVDHPSAASESLQGSGILLAFRTFQAVLGNWRRQVLSLPESGASVQHDQCDQPDDKSAHSVHLHLMTQDRCPVGTPARATTERPSASNIEPPAGTTAPPDRRPGGKGPRLTGSDRRTPLPTPRRRVIVRAAPGEDRLWSREPVMDPTDVASISCARRGFVCT